MSIDPGEVKPRYIPKKKAKRTVAPGAIGFNAASQTPVIPKRFVYREPDRPPGFRAIRLEELQHGDCKWVHGDTDFEFCGLDAGDKVYCEYHAKLAYTAPKTFARAPSRRR